MPEKGRAPTYLEVFVPLQSTVWLGIEFCDVSSLLQFFIVSFVILKSAAFWCLKLFHEELLTLQNFSILFFVPSVQKPWEVPWYLFPATVFASSSVLSTIILMCCTDFHWLDFISAAVFLISKSSLFSFHFYTLYPCFMDAIYSYFSKDINSFLKFYFFPYSLFCFILNLKNF